MKTRADTRLVVGVAVAGILASGIGASNVDPEHKFAWAENVGWTNWRDADGASSGVVVGPTFLTGFIWGENVGWINVGDGTPSDGTHYANETGADSGVNIDPDTGDLSGLAWGENVGWVNFDTSSAGDQRARFDACERAFSGFVWGENVGWINLEDAEHAVRVGPCAVGDYDCDGNVDLDDYREFYDRSGTGGPSGDCPAFDSDGDGNLDLLDWGAFQAAFTG